MKCLILAGGFATRLYPLTIKTAKAFLEYNGKPVITHIVERVPDRIDVLVSTNKTFETDFLSWRNQLDRPVEICVEESVTEQQKKGATSAVDYWIQTKEISEDLLIIAADNYFEFDVAKMISQFNGEHALVAVRDFGDKEKLCHDHQPCQFGLVTLDGTRVIRFDEKPLEPTSSIAATGIYILPSIKFPLLSRFCNQGKQDNLGSFMRYLVENDNVFAYSFDSPWLDIGDEIIKNRYSPSLS